MLLLLLVFWEFHMKEFLTIQADRQLAIHIQCTVPLSECPVGVEFEKVVVLDQTAAGHLHTHDARIVYHSRNIGKCELFPNLLISDVEHLLSECNFCLCVGDVFDPISRDRQPAGMHPQHIMDFEVWLTVGLLDHFQLCSQILFAKADLF